MVRVQVLEKRLRATYGAFMHRTMAEALKGQKKGIWKIMDQDGAMLAEDELEYRTREMLSDRHSEQYMTRSKFRKRTGGGGGLQVKDLFGGDYGSRGQTG